MRAALAGMITLLALYTPITSGSDEDPLAKDAKLISPYVYKMDTFGKWGDWDSQDGKHGYIRYVIFEGGYEEVSDKLVIQWVSVERDVDPKIVASVMVDDIVPGVFRESMKISENPYVIHLSVDNLICGEPQEYEVRITGIGKYAFKTLNKKPCDGT